jgi:flagellar basal body-associated protein FliL
MADALTIAEEPPEATKKKPGLLKRLLVPFLMLLVGVGGGAAAMFFLPSLLPAAGPPKPPAPKVAPLTYVELDNSFTANLKASSRFIQVKIALSTHGGETVSDAVERHKPAIVAAVLATLAETSAEDLDAPGGRDRLTTRMRLAINDVLQRKSGVAGVDDVFLTNFVVQ